MAVLELSFAQTALRSLMDSSGATAALGDAGSVVRAVLVTVGVLVIATLRASRRLGIGARDLWIRLGLTSAPRLSALGAAAVAAQCMGLAAAWVAGAPVAAPVTADTGRLMEIVLLAPLREELVFRGVLVNLFYRHTSVWRDERDILAAQVLGPAVLFSAVHLVNFTRGNYAASYIVVQVVLGFIVGMFYSIRFVATNSLWETIFLHIGNNFFSSFLPVGASLNLLDPRVGFPLLQSLLFYLSLVHYGWRNLVSAIDDHVEGLPFQKDLIEIQESLKEAENSIADLTDAFPSSRAKRRKTKNASDVLRSEKYM